jgi:predicted ATPase
VRLASIQQPEVVASAIAQTLGFKESSGQSPQELLAAWLRDKRLLLVLDNLEHLLEAAPLVTELLAAAPGLSVLATAARRCMSTASISSGCRRWRCRPAILAHLPLAGHQ